MIKMNVIHALMIFLCICSGVGCEGKSQADFGTPEATFQVLLTAIKSRNISLYEQCFSKTAIERDEAMLKKFQKDNNRTWTELEGMFKGPQTIQVAMAGADRAKGSVDAPNADGGGIGGITFEKEGADWKVRAW